MFLDTNEAYPPARIENGMFPAFGMGCGGQEPSWLVRIMPFIEANNVYQEWDLSAPFSLHPDVAKDTALQVFCCPTRRSVAEAVSDDANITIGATLPCGCGGSENIAVVGGATGDYVGNHGDPSPGSRGKSSDYWRGGNGTGVIISSRAKCIRHPSLNIGMVPGRWTDLMTVKKVSDGLSNTFLLGELHVQPGRLNQMPFNGPIYNGEDLAAFARIGGPTVPIAKSPNEEPGAIFGFGSWHLGVCNFAMADGSTRSVNNNLDTETLGQLCHRGDGNYVSVDQ